MVAVISDGTSSVTLRRTNDSAILMRLANRVTGGGLKPSEIATPTPVITADMKRRGTVAEATFLDAINAMPLAGVVYVTEREIQPVRVTIPTVITQTDGMDSAVVELLSR